MFNRGSRSTQTLVVDFPFHVSFATLTLSTPSELVFTSSQAERLSEIRHIAANHPELQDQLMQQQRLIHEQQRLADEARLELWMMKIFSV